MGEALMFRAGSGGDIGGGSWTLKTEFIDSTRQFYIPDNIKDNQIFVRLFGGGGGGCWFRVSGSGIAMAGGGGGWMNSGFVNVTPGETVTVTIGSGGANNGGTSLSVMQAKSGGTTSLGSYLSAAGGTGAYLRIDSGNDRPIQTNAGSGGAGGGAYANRNNVVGGRGYQFGGGAASGNNATVGSGGEWGGAGGTSYGAASNGINTISIIDETDVYNSYGIGYGVGGGASGGGGGYGANGGSVLQYSSGAGGGGGYGANGNGGCASSTATDQAGGGGAYGHGGGASSNPTYGGGGGAKSAGASGICILQYYVKG